MALQTFNNDKSGPRGYTLRLRIVEESTDAITNTSLLSYTLQIISTGYSFGQFSIGYTVLINGSTVASQARAAGVKYSMGKNSTLDLVSGQVTVNHNEDGTKVIATGGSIDMATDNSAGTPIAPGAMTLNSANMTLTDIARSSTFTISDGTLGTAQTITVTKRLADYTHTITYVCGSNTGTICTKSSNTSISWTPPISLASANTTGTSVSVTLTLTTFNGDTEMGTYTHTVSMAIPSSIVPTVTITTSNPEGHLSTYGGYIQNHSTCAISLNITTAYGSPIQSYNIRVGTKLQYTTNGVTTPVLPEAGDSLDSYNLPISVVITDGRGRIGSASVNIVVFPYEDPKITAVSMQRTTSGSPDPSGAYSTVTFSSTVSPINNHNTATYKLYYKTSSASTYSNTTLSDYTNNYSVTNGTKTFSANVSNSYMAYIAVTDAFGTVNSVVVRIQSSSAYFQADPDNNAFTFGKLETAVNTFMCAWSAVFDGTVSIGTIGDLATAIGAKAPIASPAFTGTPSAPTAAAGTNTTQLATTAFVQGEKPADYVVESGTSGNWTYRKWNSGISECWQYTNKSDTGASWHGATEFYGQTYTYPTNLFNATPMLQVTANSDPATWARVYGVGSSTTTPTIGAVRLGTDYVGQSKTIYYSIHATGTWK